MATLEWLSGFTNVLCHFEASGSLRFTFNSLRSTVAARTMVNHILSPPSRLPSSLTTITTNTTQTLTPNSSNTQTPTWSTRAESVFASQTSASTTTLTHTLSTRSTWSMAYPTSRLQLESSSSSSFVDISPDFDFMGCPEVQIRCTIDDEDVKWALSAAELARLRAQHNMRRINFFDTERFIDGRWMRCALSFGELRVDDSVSWTPRDVFRQSVDRGRILVTVTQGATQPWGPELVWPDECAQGVKTISGAAMEGRQITHALEAVPFEECSQPWQDWHFVPAIWRTGPIELQIRYGPQEALELLGIALNDVKNEAEDRKDPTIKTERAPVMPKLEAEAVVKIEDGNMDVQRPPVKSESSKSRRKTFSSRAVKQDQEQDAPVSGNKRKRAATKPTPTSKKVKRERLSVNPKLEQDGPSSGTRPKARAKAEASNVASMSNASAEATKSTSRQQRDGDNDDDDDADEVEFISSRPVRQVMGRYVIDD